jgi:hypothetical protein
MYKPVECSSGTSLSSYSVEVSCSPIYWLPGRLDCGCDDSHDKRLHTIKTVFLYPDSASDKLYTSALVESDLVRVGKFTNQPEAQ